MNDEFLDVLRKHQVIAFEWLQVDDWTFEIRTRGGASEQLVKELKDTLPGFCEVKGGALVEH